MSNKNRKFNPEIAKVARELTGKFFRERREELGLTQGQLAEQAGMLQYQVSKFESGEQNITINNLFALAGCLRVKILYEEMNQNTPAGFQPSEKN